MSMPLYENRTMSKLASPNQFKFLASPCLIRCRLSGRVAADRLDEQELDRLPIVLPGETLKGKPEYPRLPSPPLCHRSRSRSRQPVALDPLDGNALVVDGAFLN